MSAVDWNDIGNLEFCTGSGWEGSGNKIVGVFQREDGMLIVVQRPSGVHVHFVVDAEGRVYDGRKIIRNKPRQVKLQESWSVYDLDGRYCVTVFSEDAAEWKAGKGFIIRHRPAETVEV